MLGGGADQADRLEEILNEVSSPKSGGRDLGACILPPGIIKLQTSCVIDGLVGQRLVGACNTDARDGPRSWAPTWTGIGGTSLYWGGAADEDLAVLAIQNVRNFFLEYLDIHLAASPTANHAGIGIHWQNPDGPGPGENGCFHVAIVSPAHGNIGMKFGETALNANIDTFKSLFQHFKNLATGVLVVHDQGLVWRFFGPSFRNVDTFFHFERGGNFFVQSFHAADSGGAGREVLTVCKVTAGGANAGQYRIDGGYIDRQGTGQHVVIFDFWEAANTCIGSVSGVSLRQLTGTKVFDGTKPASFEVGNRNVVHANGCNLQDQPIVRFRGVPTLGRAPLVQLDACIVPSGRAVGGELVTCNEGGCAGEVILNNCQREHEFFSATVGQLGGPGNANTHKDEDQDSDSTHIGKRGFDAWPHRGASDEIAQFYTDVDPAGPGPEDTGSWLGLTYRKTGFLAAYWRFDDPLLSTTLKDISGNGRNLSVNDAVQVEDAPLPYLERCLNWSNKTTPIALQTGITADPEIDDLTIFGFAKFNDFSDEQIMFGIDPISPTGNPRLWIGSVLTNGSMSITRNDGNGSAVGTFTAGDWFHFIFTWDASAEWIKVFINGIKLTDESNLTFKGVAAGNLMIGASHAASDREFHGRYSRVGILKGRVLSDKEATLLFLRSSASVKRGFVRPS